MTSPTTPQPTDEELLESMQAAAYKSELMRFYRIQAREQIKLQVAQAVRESPHPAAHLIPPSNTDEVHYTVLDKIEIAVKLLLDVPRMLLLLSCYGLLLWLFYRIIIGTILQ